MAKNTLENFEAGTAEMIRLAAWDTIISKQFAKQIIRCLLSAQCFPSRKIV